MSNIPTNTDDTIDSRDVIACIRELEEERDNWQDQFSWEEMYPDRVQELESFTNLQKEGEASTSDWEDGVTLVRGSHFKKYAKELAEDIGAIPSGAKWPCTCIDWEAAAEELQYDYTRISFDGVDYWVL